MIRWVGSFSRFDLFCWREYLLKHGKLVNHQWWSGWNSCDKICFFFCLNTHVDELVCILISEAIWQKKKQNLELMWWCWYNVSVHEYLWFCLNNKTAQQYARYVAKLCVPKLLDWSYKLLNKFHTSILLWLSVFSILLQLLENTG